MDNSQQNRDRDLPQIPPGTCNLTTGSKTDRGGGENQEIRNSALLVCSEDKNMVMLMKDSVGERAQVAEKRKEKKEEKRKEKEKKVQEKKKREKERENQGGKIFPAPSPGWIYDLSTSQSRANENDGFTTTATPGLGVYDVDGKYDCEGKENPAHTRKVRIICISDTHNQTPARLPQGDILIHAGDLTNSGTYKELSKVADWLKNLKGYEHKIVLPGNHDLGLDRTWVEDFGYEIGVYLEEKRSESEGAKTWKECVELFVGEEARRKGIVYMGPEEEDYKDISRSDKIPEGEDGEDSVGEDGEKERQARIPGKMRTLRLNSGVKFTIWGCPGILRILRPELSEEGRSSRGIQPGDTSINTAKPRRRWAFGYSTPVSLEESPWADIPASGIDILLTHIPPKYHLDHFDTSALSTSGASAPESLTGQVGLERATFLGCEFLRRALWKTKPRLHVFGHVHHGRGAQIVRWDTESKWVKWREENVKEWVDPGGNKLCLVDLTGRGKGKTTNWKDVVEEGMGVMRDGIRVGEKNDEEQRGQKCQGNTSLQGSELLSHTQSLTSTNTSISPLNHHTPTSPLPPSHPTHHIHTQLTPPSAPQLVPGKETCLVNASYMPTSYFFRRAMHAAAAAAAVAGDANGDVDDDATSGYGKRKKRGPEKLYSEKANIVNKPFVIDLDLDLDGHNVGRS